MPDLADSNPPGADLKNRYYAMRHGHSEANAAGIIISDPAIGLTRYGLTGEGRRQVENALRSQQLIDSACRVVSSDFLRARETAQMVHRAISAEYPVHFETRLRERFFGEHDQGVDSVYQTVWDFDIIDPDHRRHGVESVNAVLDRAAGVINDLEQQFDNAVFLLVAHGDILQILQTAFAGVEPQHHRALPHLETAEIRLLNTA